MTAAQIQPKFAPAELLGNVATLETIELEAFFQQVAQLLALRKSPSLSGRETQILQKINEGYPTMLQQRYDVLMRISENRPLSQAEQAELEALTDQFEALDAERLNHIMELAQLRGVPVARMLQQFSAN